MLHHYPHFIVEETKAQRKPRNLVLVKVGSGLGIQASTLAVGVLSSREGLEKNSEAHTGVGTVPE